MSDDLDNLLRAAMKTLDEQVPSGYFEALPNQTLARLEGSSMQHGTGTTSDVKNAAMIPPGLEPDTQPTEKQEAAAVVQPRERDEDSGLHDIRNLAQSTKQRLSKKSVTQNPPMKDEDILASSSGSFKNIALPQPAKMVSLPELADLPSKKEVLAAEKAAAKDAKRSAKASKAPAIADDASVSLAAVAKIADAPAPEVAAVPARSGFSLPSQQNKRSKAPLFAVLGIGVAAAAGAVIYTQMGGTQASEKSAPAVAQADQNGAANTIAAAPKAPEAAAPAAQPEERAKTDEELKAEAALEQAKQDAAKAEAEAAAAGATATGADTAATPPTKAASKTAKGGKKGDHKVEVDLNAGGKTETKTQDDKDKKPVDPKTKVNTGSVGGGDSQQNPESFDQLLKEAGVEEKKDAKPKLEKKSLTTDDFKAGMATVAEKAQACYKGTQGTASVKLTIAPSGAVSKVTVGGAFAGKPEASCVEAAVKSAKFPPWDGGPQSFTYAYMLSD